MVSDGADIIDIGGESTRPVYTPVTIEEEIERVAPIIEKIKATLPVPISIDTFKSETAEAAINAGEDMINDIWGAKYDPRIAKVAAEYQVDRKSTRLNSSHVAISYAVFCLTKIMTKL